MRHNSSTPNEVRRVSLIADTPPDIAAASLVNVANMYGCICRAVYAGVVLTVQPGSSVEQVLAMYEAAMVTPDDH